MDPTPQAESLITDGLVDELIEHGVLIDVPTLKEDFHVSPGFLSKKKTLGDEPQKYILLVDLRRLNMRLSVPGYDIQTITDFVKVRRDTKWFSENDVYNAFFTRILDDLIGLCSRESRVN